MIELGLKVTAAYLLGSILGSLVVGRIRGGIDIRKLGSGNAGGTNALRTQGKWFALWVMVIDVGKGVVPVLVLPGLAIPGIGIDTQVSRELIVYSVALGTVIGHVYPIWHDFRGGKGGATAVGAACAIVPELALPAFAIWLTVVVLTRYVGLATMSVAVGAAIYVGLTRLPDGYGLFIFLLLIATLIIYTHRENIRRMRAGNESRTELIRFGR